MSNGSRPSGPRGAVRSGTVVPSAVSGASLARERRLCHQVPNLIRVGIKVLSLLKSGSPVKMLLSSAIDFTGQVKSQGLTGSQCGCNGCVDPWATAISLCRLLIK